MTEFKKIIAFNGITLERIKKHCKVTHLSAWRFVNEPQKMTPVRRAEMARLLKMTINDINMVIDGDATVQLMVIPTERFIVTGKRKR